MEDLKWPMDECERCGFDLTKVPPKPRDKTGLSSDGLKTRMYTDFCPNCAKPYQVGYVDVPEKREIAQVKPIVALPSPNKETEEPESVINDESEGEPQSIAISQVLSEESSEETTPTPTETEQDKKLACPNCGKVCKNKAGLSSHVRSHKKEE